MLVFVVMLAAFPYAHSIMLDALYIPLIIMLIGLVLRGVSFGFRTRAKVEHRAIWGGLFALASFMTAVSQGWMMGSYVTGLESGTVNTLFSLGVAITLPALYIMLACGWVFIKIDDFLYDKARKWALLTVLPMGAGLFFISIATPIVSGAIAQKWFSLPAAIGLLPIPLISLSAFAMIILILKKERFMDEGHGWIVFVCMIVICIMASLGLSYSIYPDIIINRLTINDVAASAAMLNATFIGIIIAVPLIISYTVFAHKAFSSRK